MSYNNWKKMVNSPDIHICISFITQRSFMDLWSSCLSTQYSNLPFELCERLTKHYMTMNTTFAFRSPKPCYIDSYVDSVIDAPFHHRDKASLWNGIICSHSPCPKNHKLTSWLFILTFLHVYNVFTLVQSCRASHVSNQYSISGQ